MVLPYPPSPSSLLPRSLDAHLHPSHCLRSNGAAAHCKPSSWYSMTEWVCSRMCARACVSIAECVRNCVHHRQDVCTFRTPFLCTPEGFRGCTGWGQGVGGEVGVDVRVHVWMWEWWRAGGLCRGGGGQMGREIEVKQKVQHALWSVCLVCAELHTTHIYIQRSGVCAGSLVRFATNLVGNRKSPICNTGAPVVSIIQQQNNFFQTNTDSGILLSIISWHRQNVCDARPARVSSEELLSNTAD